MAESQRTPDEPNAVILDIIDSYELIFEVDKLEDGTYDATQSRSKYALIGTGDTAHDAIIDYVEQHRAALEADKGKERSA